MALFKRTKREAGTSESQQELEGGIVWGCRAHHPALMDPHYAVIGRTGSGKTLTIEMLMRSVMGEGPRPKVRAVVYDPKLDAYPLLRGLGIEDRYIHILHPFDRRCKAWNAAKDVDSPAAARQLAAVLCPADERASDPFWTSSAQRLVEGVITALQAKAPERWMLNDVVESVATKARLERLLTSCPETSDLVGRYFLNDKTISSILSTIDTKLGAVGLAAAAWARRPESARFSLKEWMQGEPSVLVLGVDDSADESVAPLTRAVFRRASQLITGQPDGGDANQTPTWVFLDEVRLAGRLEGLDRLLLKGRSKRAHVVLGFQDLLGMREVYGQYVADEMVGQCGNLAFLRISNPETQRWVTSYFGNVIKAEESYSESQGSSWQGTSGGWSTSSSTSVSQQMRPFLMEQELHGLELPSRERGTGIGGIFVTPHKWLPPEPDAAALNQLLPSRDTESSGFEPAPSDIQRRLPWDDARKELFGIEDEVTTSGSSAEDTTGGLESAS